MECKLQSCLIDSQIGHWIDHQQKLSTSRREGERSGNGHHRQISIESIESFCVYLSIPINLHLSMHSRCTCLRGATNDTETCSRLTVSIPSINFKKRELFIMRGALTQSLPIQTLKSHWTQILCIKYIVVIRNDVLSGLAVEEGGNDRSASHYKSRN